MRYSLRTFLVVAIVVSSILGLWGRSVRQRRIEQELIARSGSPAHLGDFNVDDDMTDDQLIALFERYAPRTRDEPEVGNIAAHAMGNLVIRHHPKGLEFANQYWNTDVSPLWESAVYCLLYHYDLPTYLDYETPEMYIEEGYDPNSPLGEFVLAAGVHWDFVKSEEFYTLRDNWHDPKMRAAYEDAIGALEQVYPPAAKPYARGITILQETDAEIPTPAAYEDELSDVSREVVNILASSEATVLRHLIRHPELDTKNLGQKSPRPWE